VNKVSLIDWAKGYVAASNAHDLELIRPMFRETAVYQSSGVGFHEGGAQIVAMMEGFLGANPDVHWQVQNYKTIEGNGVEFDFIMCMGGEKSKGVERIFFDETGAIIRIEMIR